MSRNRQAFSILWLAILLALAYGLLARAGLWRAQLAETNFQANLIRLQTFYFEPPPHSVLVGSSMTGRLLPSYFEGTSLARIANLGLDGSGSLFGLELVRTNPVPVVIIEENTFLRPPNSNETLLAATLAGFNFRLSKYVPLLRAKSRPSSILYTWLKLRSKQGAVGITTEPPASAESDTNSLPSPSEDASYKAVHNQLRDGIKQLIEHGCRVVLLRLPSGRGVASPNDQAAALSEALMREFNLVRVDLGKESANRGEPLTYTDGVHLTASSARQASRLLAEVLANRSSLLKAQRVLDRTAAGNLSGRRTEK
jgi:hypothetical protein